MLPLDVCVDRFSGPSSVLWSSWLWSGMSGPVRRYACRPLDCFPCSWSAPRQRCAVLCRDFPRKPKTNWPRQTFLRPISKQVHVNSLIIFLYHKWGAIRQCLPQMNAAAGRIDRDQPVKSQMKDYSTSFVFSKFTINFLLYYYLNRGLSKGYVLSIQKMA